MNSAGQFVVDPGEPDQRAARLLQMLHAAPIYRARLAPYMEAEAHDESDDGEEEAYDDGEDSEVWEGWESDESSALWGG
jgi:hypothetical protein